MVSPEDYLSAKTVKAYEIDLAGSGGSLSNGTVSLGGSDFTLAGVGTSTLISFDLNVTDLYADYDGSKHSIEICAYVSSVSMGQSNGVSGIIRLDSTSTYSNFLVLYEFGGQVYQQAGSNTDGTDSTTTGRQRTSTYASLERWGVNGNGGMTSGSFGTGASGAFRVAESAALESFSIVDQTTYTERFGTGDKVRFYASRWSGGGVSASASQGAGGVTITFGTQTTTFEKLFVFIGTPEVS